MNTISHPSPIEAAKSDNDISTGYIDKLMQPEDSIVLTKGGGDIKIYQELLRDEQVLSTWQQRRMAVISKETYVEPGGTSAIDKKAADALQENMKSLNWDDIVDKMMYGIFYGYGVGELMWSRDITGHYHIDDIKVRKARRFRFGLGGELYLLTQDEPTGKLMQSDFKGRITRGNRNPYGPKFWTYSSGADNSDSHYGIGLGHQLYWPVFFKRNDIKFWLIFLEKFGSPTATAKLPKSMLDDNAEKSKVLAALRALSSDSAVVFPEGAEIDLIEAARSGTADYATLHQRMDAAIAKVILSQTMTTDDGSSRAQAEVHKQVRDEVVKADADLLCGSFNRTVARWWTELNFAGAKPPKVWRKTQDDEDPEARAERDSKIRGLGYRPTKEYLIKTYGEEYEKWESRISGPSGSYSADFAEAVTVGKVGFDVEPETALTYFKQKGLKETFSWQDMLAEAHSEALVVAKMMDLDLLSEIRNQVDQALAKGTTLHDFKKNLIPKLQDAGWWGRKAVVDPKTGQVVKAQLGSARRLETIFRTNLQTAYSAGHWANAQATKAAMPYLMYDAVDDTRTRHEHKSLDGLVLPVDDPFWNTHYPPNGWNCRCGVIQMSQQDLDTEGLKPSKRPRIKKRRLLNPRTGKTHRVPQTLDLGWDYNPGKAGYQRLLVLLREKLNELPRSMRQSVLQWAANNDIKV